MKNKNNILAIALLTLLSNCAQPPTNPVSIQPTPSSAPTSVPSPDQTEKPIPSPTQTETPMPSATANAAIAVTDTSTSEIASGELSSPPYLVYVKKINGKEQAVLVNQDGSGLKILPLPDNGFNAGNPSPTGEWLVFYTGSGGEQTLTDGPVFDLALNMMHLPDGVTHKVTDLLSKDFLGDLQRFAEIAKSNDPDIASMDTATIVDEVRRSLIYRLMISRWSSSGEVLAFSGEMDGPSTDLYLYRLKTSEIQRLSSGSKNIDFIKWFPNGKQILYSSSYLPCEGDCSTYYVTNLDGSVSRELINFDTFGGATRIDGWSGDSLLTRLYRK